MAYYLPHLPTDASDELRLAYAAVGAISKILPVLGAANPANRDALYGMMNDVVQKYGQGDGDAATFIRDNLAAPPKD